MPEAGGGVKPRDTGRRSVEISPRGHARKTLITYVESLQGSTDQIAVKAALDAWFAEADKANWTNSAAVKQSYSTASIITASRVEPMLGTRNRVSEVLNRRRGMSIEMIRALHDGLHIPTEMSIRPSKIPA